MHLELRLLCNRVNLRAGTLVRLILSDTNSVNVTGINQKARHKVCLFLNIWLRILGDPVFSGKPCKAFYIFPFAQ